MKAKRLYRLIHHRGGLLPAALADPARVDHVELIESASGQAVLCWDLSPLGARRLLRALRSDLAALEEEQFRARWLEGEHEQDWGEEQGAREDCTEPGDLDEWS
ncbi:MAG TPA: hypothetical protein VKU89_01580 [Solirubrobacteraceae bacterium]|nr:hypothetical protein [Solirubrobacteraceae bacterium]